MVNDKEMNRIFANNLEYFMKLNAKTQNDIAKALDVTQSAVSTWLTGRRVPRMSKVDALCEYFSVTRNDLLCDNSRKQKTKGYYIDEETKGIAQEIYENRDLRVLFDAARDVKREDMHLVIEMIKRFKGE